MKKMTLSTLIFMMLLLLAPLTYAEIYMYVDENGQKRWTDDLSQIPVSQRQAVKTMESDTSESGTNSTALPGVPDTSSTPVSFTPDNDVDAETMERNSLETEKAELDRIYKELADERKVIQQMSTEPLNTADRSALNARIKTFNDKIEAYETRLSQFNEKINAYNQKVMKNDQQPGEPEDQEEEETP